MERDKIKTKMSRNETKRKQGRKKVREKHEDVDEKMLDKKVKHCIHRAITNVCMLDIWELGNILR